LEPNAHAIAESLNNLKSAIDNTVGFSVKQQNPTQKRDQLAGQLNKQAQSAWKQIAPWIRAAR